jgi:hypothetical protein
MERGGSMSPWVFADDAAKVSLPVIVGRSPSGRSRLFPILSVRVRSADHEDLFRRQKLSIRMT